MRDAASTAYAKAALAFPEECQADVEEIYPLWFSLLDDNIFSVREDAAAALCDVILAYGQPALDKILPVLRYSTKGVSCYSAPSKISQSIILAVQYKCVALQTKSNETCSYACQK